MKAGRPPVCRYSVRMSGVLGHRLGRKNSRMGGCASSLKYWYSSGAVLRQAKYVYDWLNPSLASRNITLGRVKASARKMTSGCSRLTSPISHSQNENGFVCGLSTRNTRTPCSIQNMTIESSSAHSSRQCSVSKSNGKMSSYFLGGFSANWMEPSGLCRNNSGCSRVYGWYGEEWKEKSRDR